WSVSRLASGRRRVVPGQSVRRGHRTGARRHGSAIDADPPAVRHLPRCGGLCCLAHRRAAARLVPVAVLNFIHGVGTSPATLLPELTPTPKRSRYPREASGCRSMCNELWLGIAESAMSAVFLFRLRLNSHVDLDRPLQGERHASSISYASRCVIQHI